MPKWMKPQEEMPDVEAGDRILVIVREREEVESPLENKLLILEATEDGWFSPDPDYAGYSVTDGILWSAEKDVCQIANIV